MGIPLSVLDLSPVVSGSTHSDALRSSIALAQATENFGYQRYWFAEHHYAAVASTSPDVLIGQVLAATQQIRVGSAAVLLGYYSATHVVERFGILAALYPGRVDLGVGRSASTAKERMAPKDSPSRSAATAESPPQSATTSQPEEQRTYDPDSWPWVNGVLIPQLNPAHLRIKGGDSRRERQDRETQLFLPGSSVGDYGDQVQEIVELLAGTRTTPEGFPLRVAIAEESDLDPLLFGVSPGKSATIAAQQGLAFVAGYHVAPGSAVDAAQTYRENFVPSKKYSEPHLIVSADVVVADTDARAQELALGYAPWVLSARTRGSVIPYPAPSEVSALHESERAVVEDRLRTQFVGSPSTVVERLEALARETQAKELVITTITHSYADRLRSYELLAQAWK